MEPKYCPTLKKYIPFGEFYCHQCEHCDEIYCAPPDAVISDSSPFWNPDLSRQENIGNIKFYKRNEDLCRAGYDHCNFMPNFPHDPVSYWSGNPRSCCLDDGFKESEEKKERRKAKAKVAYQKKKKEEEERKMTRLMKNQSTLPYTKKCLG